MNNYLWFITLACLSVPSLPAQEQAGRDTIFSVSPVIISATHATARISPVTFSDIRREQIQQRYSVKDIPSLLSEMPSITFYSENGNGIGYNYINLRGFDQRRLSIMVNGIPQNDPEDHNVYWIDFPDLLGSTETIQVQRGAGSAFYGPPAIGGSVNLLALPFHSTPGVTFESTFGFQEYGSTNTVALSTQKYSATFNSGLVNTHYMFYGRLGKMQTDGYRDKSWVDIQSYFFGVARLDETMSTRIHLYGGPFSDGLVYTGIPKLYNTDKRLRRTNYNYFELNEMHDTVTFAANRRPQETEQFSQPHFEVLHEVRLTPEITLFNTVFYIQGDGFYDYDGSWADTSMLRLGSSFGFPVSGNPANALIRAYVGNKQFGWLPRIEFNNERSHLTLGAEIRIHRSLHWGKIAYSENIPRQFDPDYRFYEYNGEKDILSFYAHELYTLRSDITMMADLQCIYNRYGITNEKYGHTNFSVPYIFVNPRVGINYNLDETINLYSSLAFTSREPRLKNLYAAEESWFGATPQFEADTAGGTVRYNFDKPLAQPERLFDFEAGAAYRDKEIMVALNFFWMEFTDELIKSGHVDIFGQPVTGNAERTRHIGIELEGSADLADGFSLNGNATISRNRLVDYSVIEDVQGTIVRRHSLNGNPIAGFPDFVAQLRLSQAQETWNASVSVKYVGSFYTDNTANELNKNDEYLVCNADIHYIIPIRSDIILRLRGEVYNLFNTLYTMSGEGQEFFPAAERNFVFGISLQL